MTCGIYLIINNKTNQKYIGQSNNIERRWKEHCRSKDNVYIDNAIKKHGKNNFQLKIIEVLPYDIDILNSREKYWINYYNTYNDKNHYNLTPGGDFRPLDNLLIYQKFINIVKSNDFKIKMSKVTSGKKNPFYGHKHSYLSRQKMSQTKKRNKIHNGFNNSQSKYNLWNINYCKYLKHDMCKKKEFNPCKCFNVRYNGYRLPIGGFIDFVTCEIIGDIIKAESDDMICQE